MAGTPTLVLLQHLRRLAGTRADSATPDQDLLARFLAARDEDAFLVLTRKAASTRKQASVRSWLYGMAYRLARKAQAEAAKRHARTRPTPAPAPPETSLDDLSWRELRAILHDELGRLPDSCRAAFLLCYRAPGRHGPSGHS